MWNWIDAWNWTVDLVSSALPGVIVGSAVAGIAARSTSKYLDKKAENVATKQDIKEITQKIEEAKQPFFELQEQVKGFHQLRFAAIDRRLQAHQDAFVFWVKLLNNVHSEKQKKMQVIGECQEFWQRNCLYLEPTVRDAFTEVQFAVQTHDFHMGQLGEEKTSANWDKIMDFPTVLFNAIKLTPISQENLEKVRQHAAETNKANSAP
ncbi:SPX domain-containing protein [Orrella marina]|uniref:Uncharacterized protein n=1 Tax=Orrella marina TaxID=2163011 RepID=A0A2R4XEZ8_9BURK|nr:hypothetical protein [Orrella marina]AWB32394.1 hypothetical protein DBV39_00225 [Orrella marina]